MKAYIALLLLPACMKEPEDGETEATGTTMYRDAATEPDGSDRTPVSPDPQPNASPMRVFLDVEGTATFTVSDPQCEVDEASGAFRGLYQGEADVHDDGIYLAAMSEHEFETPSGCPLPELSIGLVTGANMRGELETTTQNCDAYCAASARSHAEAECDGEADEVSCRATQEAAWQASCEASCDEPTTHRIVAETSLGASALSDLVLGGTALGTVEADLTFDHLEDDSGETVDEAP